jgi:sulfonate transport system permease protein
MAVGDLSDLKARGLRSGAPGPVRRILRAGFGVTLPWVLPAGLLGLWVLSLEQGWVRPYQLPAPPTIISTFLELLGRGELARHVGATLNRLLAGYALGAAPGVLLGLLAGTSVNFRRFLDPTVQGLRAVPSLAWVPLFLLWFGIGEQARVYLIALGAFLPVYLNTMAAVGSVDRKLIELAGAYGFGPLEVLFRVILPGSMPGVFTGLRSGLSLAWMFVVAAELIAASNGLGFMLVEGQSTMRPDRVLVSLLTFAVLGRGSDTLLAALERRLLVWRDTLATTQEDRR